MANGKLGTITVVNIKTFRGPKIYIGRGGIYGNKFPVSLGRTKCIELWLEWAREQYRHNQEFKNAVNGLAYRVLKGEDINLGCYCAPLPCHGDKLKYIIECIVARTQAAVAEENKI